MGRQSFYCCVGPRLERELSAGEGERDGEKSGGGQAGRRKRLLFRQTPFSFSSFADPEQPHREAVRVRLCRSACCGVWRGARRKESLTPSFQPLFSFSSSVLFSCTLSSPPSVLVSAVSAPLFLSALFFCPLFFCSLFFCPLFFCSLFFFSPFLVSSLLFPPSRYPIAADTLRGDEPAQETGREKGRQRHSPAPWAEGVSRRNKGMQCPRALASHGCLVWGCSGGQRWSLSAASEEQCHVAPSGRQGSEAGGESCVPRANGSSVSASRVQLPAAHEQRRLWEDAGIAAHGLHSANRVQLTRSARKGWQREARGWQRDRGAAVGSAAVGAGSPKEPQASTGSRAGRHKRRQRGLGGIAGPREAELCEPCWRRWLSRGRALAFCVGRLCCSAVKEGLTRRGHVGQTTGHER